MCRHKFIEREELPRSNSEGNMIAIRVPLSREKSGIFAGGRARKKRGRGRVSSCNLLRGLFNLARFASKTLSRVLEDELDGIVRKFSLYVNLFTDMYMTKK